MTRRKLLGPQLKNVLSGLSDHCDQHLTEVEMDLAQTTFLLSEAIEKLGASFMGIHAAVSAQQQTINELLDAHSLAPEVIEKLKTVQGEIGLHINAAVTGLQFQDMTSQLIGRTTRRVAGVRGVLSAVGCSGLSGLPENDIDEIEALLASINRALEDQSRKLESILQKSVAQTHMNSGDIELF